MIRLLTAACFVALLVACSGGGDQDRVLHMRNYDISEGDFALYWKATKLNNLVGWTAICNEIKDLQPTEAVTLIRNVSSNAPTEDNLPEGATWKPNQAPADDSVLNAAAILIKECRS